MMPDPIGAVDGNVRAVSLVSGDIDPTFTRKLTRGVNASRRASAFEDE